MADGFFGRAWRRLTRTDTAALLIVALMVVVALGSAFPQVAAPGGADAFRPRYGGLYGLLSTLGAFDLWRSPLLGLLLALLVLGTLGCTLRRGRAAARHGTFWRSLQRSASVLEHLAALALIVGTALTGTCAWRQELALAPGVAAAVGHGSAAEVRQDSFRILRRDDGSVSGYEAGVSVFDGSETTQHRIGVNEPLARRGVTYYLTGFEPAGDGTGVTLLAVHDPGYWVVVASGCLFLVASVASLLAR